MIIWRKIKNLLRIYLVLPQHAIEVRTKLHLLRHTIVGNANQTILTDDHHDTLS